MPELPEVEFAAQRLREAVLGHTLANAEALHPSQRRHFPPQAQRAVAGQVIARIERRAKVQLVHLGNGAVLEIHFRMTGDWEFTAVADSPPRLERVRFETAQGTRVSLVDGRALSVVRLHAPGAYVPLPAGPEPLTDAFSVEGLRAALGRRRGPIKPVVLDQQVVAGVGNIYASEALWEARIHPATPANTLSRERLARLRDAIRHVLETAPTGRYYARDDVSEREIWRVYGKEGDACRRCGSRIARLTQAGRSTYYCRRCQR
ncbi:MAG: bifunctional DNA-formamidopyrimidine glycosylase/DNA-(apurinic or apyrimidinic site) lyase [Gemmatimonas sp.]|jgi:formamidopyrimidine-DNA glycosylase|uniref:bifunctional DNA-formamidopyrimidine glycosylase/DNA-(apurinic or apyrimidinic site) lyase n=1 Tax=Gemmatimonas sp. TaxID=1962908 RepID=UPI00391F264D|nr:bifunctional DNA-formamidopyrimidine glycosylase/DNA-(apurinic or apyrimidinic site) lyase [Gemmatimonadota bacterium]